MKKLFIFLIFISCCVSTGFTQYAQGQSKKKNQYLSNKRLQEPLFKWVTGKYLKHGLQFSLGPTYTFTPIKGTTTTFPDSINPNQHLEVYRETKSRLGAFAEVGMVHIARRPNKIIHYYDWGLGFKIYRGGETTQANSFLNDTLVGTREGESEFLNGYLYGRFSMHNVFQMNRYLFLDNSLGVNVDYTLLPGNMGYSGAVVPFDQKFQGNINAQLNYGLGLGIKPWADRGMFFIVGIEAPIFGAYEWNGGTPQIHWFSSKYYPAHLRLKFVWLFKKGPNWCPPVETNDLDRQHAKEYQNR